jgi:hypothetical protein
VNGVLLTYNSSGHTKKDVAFPLTRPTLNFSPNPRNFIDPLKKSNLFPKYRTHLCICNQCKDMGSSACVQRLYGYRKYLAFVPFNENSHNCVWICNVFTWIGNKIKKQNKIYFRPTYPIFFFTMLAETQHFFFVWPRILFM